MRFDNTKAVLFDIDGTILNCRGAGRDAFTAALLDIFGDAGAIDSLDFNGRTDSFILGEALKNIRPDSGEYNEKIELFRKRYAELLRANIGKYKTLLLPGAGSLIKALAVEKSILLGLLTGNFTESAFIKIGLFGLERFFRFGVFGEDAAERRAMPLIAKKRIKEKYGIDIDFGRMIIIGDTLFDIDCAKFAGCISICTGTGHSDKDELLAASPDYFFSSFENYSEVLELILSI